MARHVRWSHSGPLVITSIHPNSFCCPFIVGKWELHAVPSVGRRVCKSPSPLRHTYVNSHTHTLAPSALPIMVTPPLCFVLEDEDHVAHYYAKPKQCHQELIRISTIPYSKLGRAKKYWQQLSWARAANNFQISLSS